jgi:nicotinate phosphoribosyltransferase
LADLRVTENQLDYLRSRAPYLKDDYLAFLRLFRFNMAQLDVSIDSGSLAIKVQGPQLHVSPFEIPVMATVSEIRNKIRYPEVDEAQIRKSTQHKIEQLTRLGDDVD